MLWKQLLWKQYRRTLPYVQAFALLMAIFLFVVVRVPLAQVALAFLVMQVAAILGAMWAVRIKRRMGDASPLGPR